MKKCIFTLNLSKAYDPNITGITYTLMKTWGKKIGADFYEITKRKFTRWPATYEKLQIYKLAQEMDLDWAIYIDADALINPILMDLTQHIPFDTVAHNGADLATIRWKYDRFFQRDGRHLGSATWFCMASRWCIELFKPLDDLTPEEVNANIFPMPHELKSGMKPIRLVEDYVMSRNIAKYGLKFCSFKDIYTKYGFPEGMFVWHMYAVPQEQKLIEMKKVLKGWGLVD